MRSVERQQQNFMRWQSIFLIGVFMLFGTSVATAQEKAPVDIASRINRMVAALKVARVESSNPDSELEIVPDQAQQIEKLTGEYQLMLVKYSEFINEENQEAALALMTSDLPKFEQKLKSEILLPHQGQLLTKFVFEEMVKSAGGSLVKAIAKDYSTDFGLTDQQAQKLSKIDARVKQEVAEAKRKFEEEMQRIAKTARADAEQVLTPEQIKTLRRLSRTPASK